MSTNAATMGGCDGLAGGREGMAIRTSDAFVMLDANWRFALVDAQAGTFFGRQPAELMGKPIWSELPPAVADTFRAAAEKSVNNKALAYLEEYYAPSDQWIECRIYPGEAGLRMYFHDVTERKGSEALSNGQKQLLEMIAAEAPLAEILSRLVEGLEAQSPDMVCTVLLLDADGVHLRHGAAPSVPEAFAHAIDGGLVGAAAGSCGTAVYRREAVVVEDIECDPLWRGYRDLALAHGLRACWSSPIFDAMGRVLGTFAVYFRRPMRPMPRHRRLVEIATHLASIAISREKSGADLRLSRTRYTRLVESNIIGFMIAKMDGRIVEANAMFLQMVGYSKEDLVAGRVRWDTLTPPEWKSVDRQIVALLEATGVCAPCEKEYLHKDGHRVPIRLTLARLADLPSDCICLVEDLSERKRAEEELRRSNERFLMVARATTDAVWDWDLSTDALWRNEGYQMLFGYPPADVEPTISSWKTFLHPDDRERVVEGIHRLIDGGGQAWSAEYRFRRFDGTYADIFDRGYVMRDPAGRAMRMTGAMQDITARNQAMKARAESDMRYRTLFEHAPEGILIVDPQGRLVDANVSLGRMLGWGREGLLTTTVSEIVPPEEREHIQPVLTLIKQKDFKYQREWRLRRKDGSIFPAEVIATTMPDGNVLAVIRDITDRKEAEAAAKLLTQRLALATDAAAVGIWDWDLQEDRWFATPVYSTMLGYNPEEGAGDRSRWLERLHPDDQTMVKGKIGALLAGSEEPYHYEARIRHADGSYRWIAVSGRVLSRDENGSPQRILGVRMDITHRKQSESALSDLTRQLRALALRLETFRERERTSIAREIHDVLAQELTRLKIDLIWLAKRVAQAVDEATRVAVVARVGDAITQADTAISTVQRIATELRPVILDSLGLPAAVEWQAEDFARRTAIVCRAKAFSGETKLPREQATALFRILQESLTNVARHASASEVEVELVEKNGVAILTVRDNGVGISPAQLQDPHSIGLLGMKERALAFDGTVEISSQQNGGTTVTVQLPLPAN